METNIRQSQIYSKEISKALNSQHGIQESYKALHENFEDEAPD